MRYKVPYLKACQASSSCGQSSAPSLKLGSSSNPGWTYASSSHSVCLTPVNRSVKVFRFGGATVSPSIGMTLASLDPVPPRGKRTCCHCLLFIFTRAGIQRLPLPELVMWINHDSTGRGVLFSACLPASEQIVYSSRMRFSVKNAFSSQSFQKLRKIVGTFHVKI